MRLQLALFDRTGSSSVEFFQCRHYPVECEAVSDVHKAPAHLKSFYVLATPHRIGQPWHETRKLMIEHFPSEKTDLASVGEVISRLARLDRTARRFGMPCAATTEAKNRSYDSTIGMTLPYSFSPVLQLIA